MAATAATRRITPRASTCTGASATVSVSAQGAGAGGQPERDGWSLQRPRPPSRPPTSCLGLVRVPAPTSSRVLWPSGILQAETAATVGRRRGTLPSPFTIDELDRKPSSCPFLFTWNGERFEFVTDFLGGGEMGVLGGARACSTSPIRSSTSASGAINCSRATAARDARDERARGDAVRRSRCSSSRSRIRGDVDVFPERRHDRSAEAVPRCTPSATRALPAGWSTTTATMSPTRVAQRRSPVSGRLRARAVPRLRRRPHADARSRLRRRPPPSCC